MRCRTKHPNQDAVRKMGASMGEPQAEEAQRTVPLLRIPEACRMKVALYAQERLIRLAEYDCVGGVFKRPLGVLHTKQTYRIFGIHDM